MALKEVWGPAAHELFIVGLTGGIASGKSEVLAELSRLGAFVIDADTVAHEVARPGGDVYSAIVREFGEEILDESGMIDRVRLSERVFSDPEKRSRLNNITHPAIFMEIRKRLQGCKVSARTCGIPIAVIDAALIVDIGISHFFDALVVVMAPEEIRVSRLVNKRGLTQKEAISRIKSQITDEERLKFADIVIDNSGTMDELRSAVRNAWETLLAMAEKRRG